MNISFSISLSRIHTAILLAGFTTMLTACSSEPTAADIDQVMRAESAASKNIEIHEIRKVGCAAAQGAPGYMCDVEVDATFTSRTIFGQALPPVRNKKTAKLRFYKDEGKWKAAQS